MISAKALGVLVTAASGMVPITAHDMAKHFNCGRESMLSALKELRKVGYIETIQAHIDGRFVRYSKVTESGYKSLETRLLSSLAMQNSNNSVIANSLVCKPSTPNESVEEFNTVEIEVDGMGYEFFEKTSSMDRDDNLRERAKEEARKKTKYQEQKDAKRQERWISRHEVPKEDWTSADIGYEFADRIFKIWHIKPWSVTASRFIPALATQRRKHDTNGAIEYLILDLFFDSTDFEKYDDAEQIWKLFIHRFPSFVLQAKSSMVKPNEQEEARLKAKALSRLGDDV